MPRQQLKNAEGLATEVQKECEMRLRVRRVPKPLVLLQALYPRCQRVHTQPYREEHFLADGDGVVRVQRQ